MKRCTMLYNSADDGSLDVYIYVHRDASLVLIGCCLIGLEGQNKRKLGNSDDSFNMTPNNFPSRKRKNSRLLVSAFVAPKERRMLSDVYKRCFDGPREAKTKQQSCWSRTCDL